MSTTTKLGDKFLCIPKLDVSSSNWVMFKNCFIWAIYAHGILDHIDGTSEEPVNPISNTNRTKGEFTKEQKELDKEWKKDVKEWKQSEAITKQQITSSIPDSLFMNVCAKGSAHNIWTELGKHFEKKSRMVLQSICWIGAARVWVLG